MNAAARKAFVQHALLKVEERIHGPRADIQHRWTCQCGESGPWLKHTTEQASRSILIHLNQNNAQENKTMSNAKPTTNAKSTQSTKASQTATNATNATTGMSAASAKADEKRPRVRWQSPKNPEFWVRSFKDVTDKFGPPSDPWGNVMVPAVRGAADPGKKAAKAEREAKLAEMTPEQKLEFLNAEKAAKKAAKAAKEEASMEALRAKLRKELEEEYAAKAAKPAK